MKNRERLSKMSNEELAEFICDAHEDCGECIGNSLCEYGGVHGDGMLKWLENEVEDEA